MNGYWPVSFPQKKLTRDEGSILQKDFWERIFGSENVLAVYGFLKTAFKMVIKLNDYVKDDDDDDKDDFGYHYRDNLIAQFKQVLYNKSFSHQDQDKRDDSLQKRIKVWPNYVVDYEGAPIPDNVNDYDYNDPEMGFYFRGLKYDPELRE